MPWVKNQHYVPRFYLKSFTDDAGCLSAIRRDAGGLKPAFRSKPENVCAENYLYEVKRRESVGGDGLLKRASLKMLLGKSRTILHLPTDCCSAILILENYQKVKSASS